jgi:hypothetical protein
MRNEVNDPLALWQRSEGTGQQASSVILPMKEFSRET